MQISAISPQNFEGNRSNIDRFIAIRDEDLQRYAYNKAAEKNKKRQQNLNRVWNSVPVVAAVAAAALTKGKATFLNNEVSGQAAKVANAVKNGGMWAFYLGTAAAGGALNSKLEQKSEGYRNFRKNHSILSLVGDVGLFIASTGAIIGAAKFGYNKLGSNAINTINNGVKNISQKINKYVKVPNFAKDFANKVANHIPEGVKAVKDVKVPEFVKSAGESILAWAPTITIFSAFLGSINNRSRFYRDAENIYSEVKEKQQILTQARLAELKATQQI